MNNIFEKSTFKQRLRSMLGVDFRRMFTSLTYYIMLGISFVIPILILVMTTMNTGSASVDSQAGVETDAGFTNVWQIIGSISGGEQSMSMDLTSMCNINMMFFLISIFVCLFVGNDFRSGYAKNLFTVRSKKADYVISKTIICFIAGASIIMAFFIGSMLGGAFSGLSFALKGVTAYNVLMCLLSKIFLVGVFSSIYVLASVVAKQRLWLSLLVAFGMGMLLFTMISLITPLNSTIINLVLCIAGAVLFGFGIGTISTLVLEKTNLI